MRLWVLTILSMLLPSTSAKFIKSSWGLENEALIVKCPRQDHSRYPVDWYYSNDKSISTQGRSHIVASGERLKFLPAKVSDTGFYTCIIRSPTSNKTGYVNVTIHKKQPGCHIPDHLVYTTTSGSEKNSKIVCPTIDLYNWTAPVEWFKNCEVLQGSRYQAYRAFLLIDNATSKDTGDYTCKFLHNENGVNYSVSATRSFTVIDEQSVSLFPEIIAPSQNETKDVEIADKQNTYYMLAGFSTLLLLINVFMIILKVFWIEIILLWRDIARPYKTRNDGKIYDAYVIYPRNCRNSQEGVSPVESFVHQILPDVLENKCGYNLCIYGRDLLPGEDTVTAVETSIQKSRRHIFVLTPEIIHSKELAYEQEIALHSTLIQNDSKAILIEMEALCPPGGLQFGELQESLQHLIKVQGTIKWREDHVANKHSLNSKFWKQVRYHMPVPSRLPRKTPSSKALSAQE